MLEEETVMEKKQNCRAVQPPAKAATEPKKNGDVASKYNRRRESNASNSSKNEPNKKTKVAKFADKRPRPRGQNYSGGKQETKLEDVLDDPDAGFGFDSGRKRQNFNHLLNFTLAPRPALLAASPKEKPNWLATHKHKYNKEQFLQANCQFIVKSGVNYAVQLAQPDVLVDWPNIEQIRLRSTEWMSCPICLDAPVAAKMTRCGHVFCWPCILHYLALSDKTWRKCPICYEAVHKRDLKSVVTIANSPAKVGEEFTLRLMRRNRDTLLAIPVEEADFPRDLGTPLSVKEPLLSTAYSKLLISDGEDVGKVLKLERNELERELEAVRGDPEVCFVEQALDLLSERETEMGKSGESVGEEITREEEDEESDDEDFVEYLPNVQPEDVETEQQITGQKPYYFYQAADGQNVFLTAINLRMFETQYGGLAYAPLTITASVLEKETGSMTRELRNRLRAIAHLPLTATFDLLELNMTRLVSADVMEAFAEQLQQRGDRRRRRDRDERRREQRITREEQSAWGGCRSAPRIRLESTKDFPKCGEEDEPSGSSRSVSPAVEQFPELPTDSAGGPSFAQMLKTGNSWPRSLPTVPPPPLPQCNDDDDEYSAAPRYQQSFSDAIALALERADLNAGTSGSKKKKKRKQKVVFSTGMAFTSN